MKPAIYISTNNFARDSMGDAMATLGRFGYQNVEVSSGHQDTPSDWDSAEEFAAHGGHVLFHNFAPPDPSHILLNLSAQDPDARAAVVESVKRRIEFSHQLGARYYSLNGGYRVDYAFGQKEYGGIRRVDRQAALDLMCESLLDVRELAVSLGVRVGIENHVVERGNEENLVPYLREDFEYIFNKVGDDFVGLHLDVGHLKVTSNVCGTDRDEFLRALGSTVACIHVHDNQGERDTHSPFDESAWFLQHLPDLKRLEYACIETNTGDPEQLSNMVGLLEQHLDA